MTSGSHPYSHKHQRAAISWAVVLSIPLALLLSRIFSVFQWTPPALLDTPAVLGFFEILYPFYDRVAWKTRLFRAIHGIPDLSGRYKVTIRTSHDGHATSHTANATIAQSWSELAICVETEHSSSTSLGAWFNESPGKGHSVTYTFLNTPRPSANAALHSHEGTATLVFDEARRGTGVYYNGRDRSNHGELTFEPI